jgi:putative transposase
MSTFTNLLFHIVYSTRYRRQTIEKQWQQDVHGYIGGILRQHKGTLLCAGGMQDHVHLLAKLSPSLAVSDVLRLVKSNSSKMINESFRPRTAFEWQSGYAAFSVSESQVEPVRHYILNQEAHHSCQSFDEEFLDLLKRHQVQFDVRYVFEHEVVQ